MENYKTYIRIGLVALASIILYIWIQGVLSGEQGRVRKFILQGKKAVETKNILTCADMVAMNYRDRYGNDRDALIYGGKQFFAYYKTLFVHIENMEIELDDSRTQASVEIVALLIGQAQDNTTEKILEGEKGRFRVKLIKEDKKWKVLELEFFESIEIMGQNIS